MERSSISDWLVQTLRLTLFPGIGEQIKVEKQDWWHDLLDVEASDINIQRDIGYRQEAGLYEDDKQLVLSIQPDRIDWRLTSPNKIPEPGQVPDIGPYLETIDKFSKLMLKWLNFGTCPAATRLAFGPILITPVATVEEGYEQISEYLFFNINTENASEFLYQINRARPSKSIPGTTINRLSKWSVLASHWIKGNLVQGVLATSNVLSPKVLNCRLELDINNIQKPGYEVDQNKLPNLYEEFVKLSKEIIEKGDIV